MVTDKEVFLEITPFVKFMWNYIWGLVANTYPHVHQWRDWWQRILCNQTYSFHNPFWLADTPSGRDVMAFEDKYL